MTTAKPLAEQTPIEIDTQLADIYKRQAKPAQYLASSMRHLAYLKKNLAARPEQKSWQHQIDQENERIEKYSGQLADLRAEAKPFDDEYSRRPWTRAFITVGGSTPHVHNTMYCRSTFDTTRWQWLPQFSGHDEAEIVDEAGDRACTWCFPTAPVETLGRASRIFTADEEAAAERRIERQQKAAEKAAKKAATTVTHPYGLDLYGPWDQVSDNARQVLSGAVGYVVDQLRDQSYVDRGQPEYVTKPEKAATRDARLTANTEALAQFNGITIEHQQKIIREKALAKHIKDGWTGATRFADELKALRAELRALMK